jgi:hypothetical protein
LAGIPFRSTYSVESLLLDLVNASISRRVTIQPAATTSSVAFTPPGHAFYCFLHQISLVYTTYLTPHCRLCLPLGRILVRSTYSVESLLLDLVNASISCCLTSQRAPTTNSVITPLHSFLLLAPTLSCTCIHLTPHCLLCLPPFPVRFAAFLSAAPTALNRFCLTL